MKNRILFLTIGCCAVFFWAASVYGQTIDTCSHLKEWETANPQPGDAVVAKEQYDTLRLYIEKCHNDTESYIAFSDISGAVQLYTSDTSRFDTYRDWLISVLYLNTTDPFYFCSCMYQIAHTYQFGKYHLPNAGLAVLNYLRNNKSCDGPGLEKEYQDDINSRHESWRTLLLAGDTTIEDTILPSLDQIGLGFLLTNKAPAPSNLSSQFITSFTSNPNPFKGETALNFTLNHLSYVTLAIYDELGRLVWGDGRGSSLEAGEHSIQIDGSKLPGGTLYARIATGFGEVKTVKIVHEK